MTALLYNFTEQHNTTHFQLFAHADRTSSNSTELLITLCFYTYFTLQLHCSTPELNHQYHHYHLSTCTSLLITLHSVICTCLPQLLRSASILPRMEPHLDRLHSLPLYPVHALLACYISLHFSLLFNNIELKLVPQPGGKFCHNTSPSGQI